MIEGITGLMEDTFAALTPTLTVSAQDLSLGKGNARWRQTMPNSVYDAHLTDNLT